jgi:hypothetical protein
VALIEPDLVGLDQQLIDPFPLQTVAPSYLPRGLDRPPVISLMMNSDG